MIPEKVAKIGTETAKISGLLKEIFESKVLTPFHKRILTEISLHTKRINRILKG